MNHWLVKSEPNEWSWHDQVNAGTTDWSGVTNAQAQNHMRQMKTGDRVLFYHSGKDRQIVGITEVARAPYPDPTDQTGKRVLVDLKTVEPLKSPVTLAQIKADDRFVHLPLVRQPRLSVMPIDQPSWKALLAMSRQ